MLYVGNWSAIKHNATCKECYELLLSKGKPSRVALFTVAKIPRPPATDQEGVTSNGIIAT